ncbi:MAG: cyclic diguanylate phosphodiesterase [Gammaproteobacteria bacterium]|nr:cyclic diguanylate phosphodiesterase [Gammaproteobacteria bacterium]
MYKTVSATFVIVFAVSLLTLSYFNHFYAKKALERDAEQLLYQFHDVLAEGVRVLESLPDPDQFQCNQQTIKQMAKYGYESPAIRLIGISHGDEQFCASGPIHVDLSHYQKRLMTSERNMLSNYYSMASAGYGDEHDDLLILRTHEDSSYFVSINPFMVSQLTEFACINCLAYDFEIVGEPKLTFQGKPLQGKTSIEYQAFRKEGILDVSLNLRGTESFYNYYKELSLLTTIGFALAAATLLALFTYKLLTIRQSLDHVLQGALKCDEFVPFYQPIVDSRNGEVVGAEVLVRWCRDDGSITPPYQFIPYAESSGLIIDITEQLISKVVVDVKDLGWDKTDKFASINIVPEHLSTTRFFDYFVKQLERAGIPAKNISLEITERKQISDLSAARKSLDSYYHLGTSLKLDDAGTGYGGFSYIQELGISTLKIDKMFVDTINNDDVKSSVLDAIISFAKSSGLDAIAEGVETEAQVKYLKEQGVYLIQGYFYGKPMPVEEFKQWQKNSAGR